MLLSRSCAEQISFWKISCFGRQRGIDQGVCWVLAKVCEEMRDGRCVAGIGTGVEVDKQIGIAHQLR